MAALMKGPSLSRPLGSTLSLIRWSSSSYKKKKKRPYWQDPKNLSWQEPLLERMERLKIEGRKEVEPSMLHMVFVDKPVKGRPYWEKRTLEALGLLGKMNTIMIHKNTPKVNALLMKVNHLIRIKQVTFPNGIPQTEEDFANCHLRDNGEVVLKKTVYPINVVDEENKDQWRMDVDTFRKASQRKLETHQLNAEYFPPKYEYKYNQDGKEWRYHGNHNIGRHREWN